MDGSSTEPLGLHAFAALDNPGDFVEPSMH